MYRQRSLVHMPVPSEDTNWARNGPFNVELRRWSRTFVDCLACARISYKLGSLMPASAQGSGVLVVSGLRALADRARSQTV